MNSILAIGYLTERTFNYFVSKLKEISLINFDVLDLSKIYDCKHLKIIENGAELKIAMDNEVFDFANYYGYFNRCFYSNIGFPQRNHALSKLVSSVNSFLESTKKLVVNKHSSGATNGNKFIHINELNHYGFLTPATYICGSLDSLKEISSKIPKLINKSCSGIKTIAAKVDEKLLSKAQLLENCPSLFQEQIEGVDVRIHVVSDKIFPEMIVSDSVDYRYSANNKYEGAAVPELIHNLCINYSKEHDLFFAGIDFKIDKDNGNWVALEVNPMPGYEGYDRRLKGEISKALIDLFLLKEKSRYDSNENLFINSGRRPDIQGI